MDPALDHRAQGREPAFPKADSCQPHPAQMPNALGLEGHWLPRGPRLGAVEFLPGHRFRDWALEPGGVGEVIPA